MNSHSVQEQAIQWFAKLRTTQHLDSHWPDFHAWLEKSPRHQRTYAKVDRVWADMDLEQLPREKQHLSTKTLIQAITREYEYRRLRTFLRVPVLAVLIGGNALLLMDAVRAPVEEQPWATYERGSDQVTPVRVGDHSSALLHTNTRLRIGSQGQQAQIQLDIGEAYFEVKPDAKVPLSVNAGAVSIRTQGAAFMIRKEGDGHIETLVRHGRVEITSSESLQSTAASASPIHREVSEGQIAMLSPSNHLDVAVIPQSELAQRFAWTNSSPSSTSQAHDSLSAPRDTHKPSGVISSDDGSLPSPDDSSLLNPSISSDNEYDTHPTR